MGDAQMATEAHTNPEEKGELDRLISADPPEVVIRCPGMPEANYKRPNEAFESSDDLIEDYDNFEFKPKCVEKLSGLEKLLLVVLAIFFIIILALGIALGKANNAPKRPEEVHCSNQECVKAASAIVTSLNETEPPCRDFYQYACGGWVAETPIPKGLLSWDRFQEVADKTYYKLERVLIEDRDVLPFTAENKAKKFYKSCSSAINITTEAFVASYQNLIKSVGGWTIGDNSTYEEQIWDFQTTLQTIHKLRVYPLFAAVVDIDEDEPDENIFKIDPGMMGTNPSYFTTLANDTDAQNQVNGYTDYIVRVGRTLGGDEATIRRKAEDIVQFEKTLTQILPTFKKTRDRMKMFHKLSITDLQKKAGVVQWTNYFNSIIEGSKTSPFTDSKKVVVYAPNYMQELTNIIGNYSSNDTKREILRNYMVWILVSTMEKYVGSEIFQRYRTDNVGNWKRCIFYTNKAFDFATGAIYVNSTFHESYVAEVHTIVKYIKDAFKNHLVRKHWIDEPTSKLAAEKIDAIIDKISYSSVIQNSTFLDGYYSEFTVNQSDWFDSVLRWQRFDVMKMAKRLKQKPDRESWISAPVNVNTFYSPERNDLFFPAAVFQPPFFSPGRPQALNFGALGSIIGHEITHAFDTLGRQFDKIGKLESWWGNLTAANYKITSECMVKQYQEFTYDSRSVDGNRTLVENIADNGGLNAAFMGYRLWRNHHEEQFVLPGTNLTHDQLFYLSFAQMYCGKYTPKGIFLALTGDSHSPNPARVMGVLKNSEEFTKLYNCGLAAPMNANIRCRVW